MAPSTCPVCGSKKKVYKVSGLISKGTVITSGKIRASSVSVDTHLNVAGSSTKGTYGGVSKSELVQRLSPPKRPEPGIIYAGFAAVAGGLVASQFGPGSRIGGSIGDGLLVPLLLSCVIWCVLFALIFALWYTDKRKAKIAAWDRANETLQDSFYCRRDDLCFAPGRDAQEPEEFVQAIFASPVPSTAGAAPTEDV
jgi:hypothetical protein